ncbi:MAG: Gfo/Idh/MocA family oxidoreductase [Oscillospiraceae bacterium]|nr:Gfo/Idh/MocA family oxidoreductase [Oscillospiraceae bacterium]
MKFGIVGCGMIAAFHVNAIRQIEGAELLGVADVNIDFANSFAEKHNTRAYANYQALLDDPAVDVVCICTPSGFHAENAKMALKHNKHVVVEKPMALLPEDADELVELCKSSDRLLTVISQIRFAPDIQKVKKLIEENAFGKIVQVNLSMMYCRTPEYYSGSAWKGTWKLDGGEMMNQGIHGIDIMRYLVGSVKKVHGLSKTLHHNIEAEDTAAAVLEFENGALGTINSTVAAFPGYERRLTICGTLGSVVIIEDNIEQLNLKDYTYKRDPNGKTKDVSNPSDIDVTGHVIQLTNLINAVNGTDKLLIDANENRETLQLIWGINNR